MAGIGRPSKYNPDFDKQAYKLCLLGAKDTEIADFFGVSEKTLNNWKKKYPSFLQSLKDGKITADANVSDSLYKRATGYDAPETKVFTHEGRIITHDMIKHYPPDPTSIIFWLKNRRPDLWRDKPNEEDGSEPPNITFNIHKGWDNDSETTD